MAITEDRVTIFTKNTGKYSGIALILDLTRSINHTYGSSVASHPIEGSGVTVADHQYLKNIKIQISGHVSSAVKVPLLGEKVDSFNFTRNNNTYIEEVDKVSESLKEDKIILQGVEPNVPLTEEEARVLTDGASGFEVYEEGDLLSSTNTEKVTESTERNINNTIASIKLSKSAYVEDSVQESTQGQRRVYASSQENKQLDALILLENIRDNRLLVDVLTPNRLYSDMTMNFNLPRNMRQGTALEVNLMFEQQRFNEAEVQSVPYSKESDLIEDTEGQDEKPKEVVDPNITSRADEITGGTVIHPQQIINI